tara:strand:+ start:597 stop:1775 length:1179 start_codon:yes stop_codon:yes gene_type:complete
MKPLALSLLFSLFASFAHAGNVVVLPSTAQSAIDAASSGDVIRFLPGNYPNLAVVNKDLSFTNAGGTPATIGNLEANGSVLTVIGLNAATLTVNDLPGKASSLIVTQGTYGRITTNAAKSRISYCTLNYLVLSGKGIVTGCEFKGNTSLYSSVSLGGGIGIDLHGANTHASIHNCHVKNYQLHGAHITEQCIGIRVRDGANAEIRNNLISGCKDTSSSGNETDCGMGVFVKSASHATIIGNVIWDCFVDSGSNTLTRGDRLVYADAGTVLRYNVLWNNTSNYKHVNGALVGGGVISADNVSLIHTQDPKFTDLANGDYTLASDSPAINAGPPDAQYKDRDGTRNDIGMYGGHSFIPDGRTTKKPIVLSIDASPIAVPTGGIITIESTGAVPK